jgi:hypothetical protein
LTSQEEREIAALLEPIFDADAETRSDLVAAGVVGS